MQPGRKEAMAEKITIGILGERLTNLKENLFNEKTGALPRLENLFTNHLKHHEHNESKKGDRIFKIFTVILQAAMSLGILYLLATKG